jgi:hypothetical protein
LVRESSPLLEASPDAPPEPPTGAKIPKVMACIFTTPPEVLSGRHAAKIKKKFKNAQIIFKK